MKGYLPENKHIVIAEIVDALANIKGVEAIALGGSYARGAATVDSDVDLGIYYSENSPPAIDEMRNLAKHFDSTASPIATDFYEWGPWVNGGAWLNTRVGEIDWLYRNLDQVNRVIADAKQGRFSWDFRQQPPYGFFSVMYLADLQHNIALFDPNEIFARFKEAVRTYPEALRQAIIQEHLWSVEFSHFNAKKLFKRGCLYGIAGCITRIIAELTQVLFALNRIYFVTERDALQSIESFRIKPKEYAARIEDILSSPGRNEALAGSLKKLNDIIQEVIKLSSPLYTPKFSMD